MDGTLKRRSEWMKRFLQFLANGIVALLILCSTGDTVLSHGLLLLYVSLLLWVKPGSRIDCDSSRHVAAQALLIVIVGSMGVYYCQLVNNSGRKDICIVLGMVGGILIGGSVSAWSLRFIDVSILVALTANFFVGAWQFFWDPGFYPLPGLSRVGYMQLGRASGFYNNPNHLAFFASLAGLYFFGRYLMFESNERKRLVLVIYVVFAFGIAVMTRSRVALALFVIIGFSLFLLATRQEVVTERRRPKGYAILGICGIFACATVAVFYARGSGDGLVESFGHRKLMAEVSAKQWNENLLQGTEGTDFMSYFRKWRPVSWPVSFEDTDPVYAHNDILQLLGEYGLMGLCLFCLIGSAVVVMAGDKSDGRISVRRLILLGSIFLYVVSHSFFDFPLRASPNSLWLGVILGSVAALRVRQGGVLDGSGEGSGRCSYLVVRLGIFVCSIHILYSWGEAALLARRGDLADRYSVERAHLLMKAHAADPSHRRYPTEAGTAYAVIGRRFGQDGAVGRSFLRKAKDAYSAAVAIDQNYFPAIEGLSVVYDELGQYQRAELLHQRALELAPRHRRIRVNYALHLHALALATGDEVDRVRARRYYELVYSEYGGSGDARLVEGWKVFTTE